MSHGFNMLFDFHRFNIKFRYCPDFTILSQNPVLHTWPSTVYVSLEITRVPSSNPVSSFWNFYYELINVIKVQIYQKCNSIYEPHIYVILLYYSILSISINWTFGPVKVRHSPKRNLLYVTWAFPYLVYLLSINEW